MTQTSWYNSIEKSTEPEQIKLQVDRLQKRYRTWIGLSSAVVSVGVVILVLVGATNPIYLTLGLFVAMSGLVLSAAAKIQAAISLSMYRILLTGHRA